MSALSLPFYHQSMMIPMFQYPPSMMYPNYMSTPVYPSQGKNNSYCVFNVMCFACSSSYGYGLSTTSFTLTFSKWTILFWLRNSMFCFNYSGHHLVSSLELISLPQMVYLENCSLTNRRDTQVVTWRLGRYPTPVHFQILTRTNSTATTSRINCLIYSRVNIQLNLLLIVYWHLNKLLGFCFTYSEFLYCHKHIFYLNI